MDRDKEWQALCLQLAMLDRMMKFHAWTTFAQKEIEDLENSASQIESEVCQVKTEGHTQ